jgi:hypothetical protein
VTLSVSPAKAGIQSGRRKPAVSLMMILADGAPHHWMPACAGMTLFKSE